MFASKYRDLYSSVPYNKSELMGITQENDAKVLRNGFTSDCNVDVSDVKRYLA